MTNDDVDSQVANLAKPDAAAPAWVGDGVLLDQARPLWIGWTIGLLVTLCLFADFATRPLMDVVQQDDAAAVFVYACFGLLPLQAVGLTAWLVFGRTSFLRRLIVHWFIVGILLLFWEAGPLMSGGPTFNSRSQDQMLLLLCRLPLISLGLQLPLWPLRLYARWRVEPSLEMDTKEAPLSIRDIMLGTTLVALTLTAARLAKSISPGSSDWVVFGALVAGMAAFSLFSLVAVARAMLRSRSARQGYLIVALYTAAVYTAVTVVGLQFARPRQDARQLLGFAITAASFASSLAVALHIVRACGYRLKIGQE